TGVERVALRQDVEMHLFLDSDSGFLGNPKEGDGKDKGKKAASAAEPKPTVPALPLDGNVTVQADVIQVPVPAAAAPPQPKSHVVIKTQGPSNYDVARSHAQFDISEHRGPYPNRVSVNRFRELGKSDELDCERLEIQFTPKDAEGPNAPAKTVKDD